MAMLAKNFIIRYNEEYEKYTRIEVSRKHQMYEQE